MEEKLAIRGEVVEEGMQARRDRCDGQVLGKSLSLARIWNEEAHSMTVFS